VNLIHFCLKRLVGTSVSVLRTRFVHWTTVLATWDIHSQNPLFSKNGCHK